MITPLFECQQTDEAVTLLVRAPHSRPRDIDITLQDCDFHFHCHPYLLHLRFPHQLTLDPEHNPANYDLDTGIATIPLIKSMRGKYFERLDMLSTLLVNRPRAKLRDGQVVMDTPKIEVVASSSNSTESSEEVSGTNKTTSSNVYDMLKLDPDKPTTTTNKPKIEVLNSTGNSLLDDEDDTTHPRNIGTNSKTEIIIPSNCGDTKPITAMEKRNISTGNSQTLLPALRSDSVSVHDSNSAFRESREQIISVGVPHYGFGQRYSGVFTARAEDLTEIVELPDPDNTPAHARSDFRRSAEDAKFDAEHYAADYMLVHEFGHVLKYSSRCNLEDTPLSNQQKDALLKLPRREYLRDVDKECCAVLGGLLYAWCYDMRVTSGENSVESAWTISRLCASFSFLEVMKSPTEAVRVAHKRSLAYPLYRHFQLSGLVLDDLKRLVDVKGIGVDKMRARLLRVLLRIRSIFEDDKMQRVFADIFLTDFCVWIQIVDDEVLRKFASEIGGIRIRKSEVGWGLEDIEAAARGGPSKVGEQNCEDTPNEIVIGASQREGIEMTAVTTRRLAAADVQIESDSASSFSSSSSSDEEDTTLRESLQVEIGR